MRTKFFIAAAVLAFLPSVSSAQALSPRQAGAMLSENNRVIEEMMVLVRDMATLMSDLNIAPTPEQRSTFELMAKKLDFMLMEHRNFMISQGMVPPAPPVP